MEGQRSWASISLRSTPDQGEPQLYQTQESPNFFNPFEETTPWNFRPQVGDRTNILGLGIADWGAYSPAEPRWSALCFDRENRAQMGALLTS